MQGMTSSSLNTDDRHLHTSKRPKGQRFLHSETHMRLASQRQHFCVLRRDEWRPPDTVSVRSASQWWGKLAQKCGPLACVTQHSCAGWARQLAKGSGFGVFWDLSLTPPQFPAPLTTCCHTCSTVYLGVLVLGNVKRYIKMVT